MKITYAIGAEEPRIAAILADLATYNSDATATVSVPDVTGSKATWRMVVLSAPELDLALAVRTEIVRLRSKRSGLNTVVTIEYKWL